VVVPTKVITTIKALAELMNQGEGGDDKVQPADGKAGQPKF